MELLESKNKWEQSDRMPTENEAQIYGDQEMDQSYVFLPRIEKRKYSDDRFEGHCKEGLKWEILMNGLLKKEQELLKLYDEYRTINKAQRECFSDRLSSQASDDKGRRTLDHPYKIETWYFLTKEEARLHIQFDQYLDSCFMECGCSPTTFKMSAGVNLKPQIFESLPKDLIARGIQRKYNQFAFVMLVKYLVHNDYRQYLVDNDYSQFNSSFLQLLSRLKNEKEFCGLHNTLLMDGLMCYMSILRRLTLRNTSDRDAREEIHDICKRKLEEISKSWEIKHKDSLIYYCALKELQRDSKKMAIENYERKHHLGSSSACSAFSDRLEDIREMVEIVSEDSEVQVWSVEQMWDELQNTETEISKGRIDGSGLDRNASIETREGDKLSKHSECMLEYARMPKQSKMSMEWMDKISSKMGIINLEIDRIKNCIRLKDIRLGTIEAIDINDVNELKIEYDGFKAAAVQHLKFVQLLDSCISVKHDSSPSEVFKILDCQGYISVPENLALSCIRDKIHQLMVLHEHGKYASFLEDLVDYEPHIKSGDDIQETYENLRSKDKLPCLPVYRIHQGLWFFLKLLSIMEITFDPLIRKAHRDDLLLLIRKTCIKKRLSKIKSWELTKAKDPIYDQVIKEMIAEKHSSTKYMYAREMVLLHEKFDRHLASSEFVKFDSSLEEVVKDERVILREFSSLPGNLIEESVNLRLHILKKMHEFDRYADFLKQLVQDESIKCGSRREELLENVKYENFSDLPEHSKVQGILVYEHLCSVMGELLTGHDKRAEALSVVNFTVELDRRSQLQILEEETRYYKEWIYEEAFEPARYSSDSELDPF